jgi:RNase H-fold protein (predicted Holliday junction resolvase)
MQYQKAHGQVISETVYTRAIHQLSPSWDFAIVIVAPPADKRPKAEYNRSQLIRHLFPDIDDYVKGEKARWSLTTEHWDESWTEVDIDSHPSLYEPY